MYNLLRVQPIDGRLMLYDQCAPRNYYDSMFKRQIMNIILSMTYRITSATVWQSYHYTNFSLATTAAKFVCGNWTMLQKYSIFSFIYSISYYYNIINRQSYCTYQGDGSRYNTQSHQLVIWWTHMPETNSDENWTIKPFECVTIKIWSSNANESLVHTFQHLTTTYKICEESAEKLIWKWRIEIE